MRTHSGGLDMYEVVEMEKELCAQLFPVPVSQHLSLEGKERSVDQMVSLGIIAKLLMAQGSP